VKVFRAGVFVVGLMGLCASAQTVVNVPAGGDVQAASLQVLAAGGGTINLAAGNYSITGSIVLGSNTTLNGAGGPGSATQSVIYAPASPNAISMVTQAYAGASNLAVSNLVLDGNIPQAAMLYGTGNGNYAYNNNGIYIYDTNTTTVGVTLTNVEVRHTLRGILTGLVDNLTISGCYFHDNNPGGFSHNMYLVATSGVEIDHTRSNNALLGDGLHIDFGGTFYTIRKSEFTGNNGLGLLSQQDNNVTIEDTRLDFNSNEGIQIDAGGLLLTRDTSSYNGGYGLQIPDTADNAGVVNGYYSIQNDPLGVGGDNGPDYIYCASLIDFTEGNPGPNAYPAIRADGVIGVTDTGDWTLNYGGYTYLGAVDFNANHLNNGAITFQVGNAVATGPYPLVIRYSNGTTGSQTLNLSVNGGTSVPVTFPPTGSYSTWATVTVNQTLSVGNNAVTFSVPTGATSAPELDLLTVTAATPPAPGAPTNVTAAVNGPYSVTLNWTPPANSNSNAAQYYNIYKNNRVPIVATKITGTSWTDTRIFYGETTNSYFVTAVNQGGESGASNSVTATTGIDAPPGLQVTVAPSTPANNLKWLGVSGAASYLVRRAIVSGGPYQTIATISASTNTQYPSYSDTALSNGQTYYYVVAAEDANGNISANSYQVIAVSETFTLAASSPSINLATTAASADTIAVTGTNGFSDQVGFSVSGLPAGVTGAFSPGSASSGGSTTLTLTDSSSSPAALGSYPLTVTGKDGGLTSSVALTLNVGLTQTITFNAIPAQAVGNSLTLVATASSGLPVTFVPVPNGNCSVSGSVVTFLNTGNCGIDAYQYGNATYGAAPSVGQIIVVNNPAAQTIAFGAISSKTVYSSVTLSASASSGLPVSYASSTASVCTVSGNTVSLLNVGTCTIIASQTGAGAYGPAASVMQSFPVNAIGTTIALTSSPASVSYGQPLTLNAKVLDANGNPANGGSVSFSLYNTATNSATTFGSSNVSASTGIASLSTTTLPVGTDTLIAVYVPSANYTVSGTNGVVTIRNMNIFIANGPGTVTTYYDNGTLQTSAVSGGGVGAAVDSSGRVWSIAAGGGGLATFSDTGASLSSYSGVAGISGGTALAIDGLGTVWVTNWVTNTAGSVSAVSNSGTAQFSTPVATAAGLNAPASISVDTAGSLWIANSGNNTVTEIIGVAAPIVTPTANAVLNNTLAKQP
jgi:hypothetical protein